MPTDTAVTDEVSTRHRNSPGSGFVMRLFRDDSAVLRRWRLLPGRRINSTEAVLFCRRGLAALSDSHLFVLCLSPADTERDLEIAP